MGFGLLPPNTHPCFGLGMMSAELPLPPQEFTLGPTYSVVREWDEGSILFPLPCFSLAS